MYSSEDFERLYIRYQAEAMPRGVSIQAYCDKNKVPYNLFDKWYRDTRHRIEPVTVENRPEPEPEKPMAPTAVTGPSATTTATNEGLRIMIDIKMSTGMHIHQRNLSYAQLRSLIAKLEALC